MSVTLWLEHWRRTASSSTANRLSRCSRQSWRPTQMRSDHRRQLHRPSTPPRFCCGGWRTMAAGRLYGEESRLLSCWQAMATPCCRRRCWTPPVMAATPGRVRPLRRRQPHSRYPRRRQHHRRHPRCRLSRRKHSRLSCPSEEASEAGASGPLSSRRMRTRLGLVRMVRVMRLPPAPRRVKRTTHRWRARQLAATWQQLRRCMRRTLTRSSPRRRSAPTARPSSMIASSPTSICRRRWPTAWTPI
mmetsp:Transcript_1805/g.4048  ORF Transcript_1805/g.4048 Transcript_1805/m.4048 type:complete len:245 (+) Transcript_1805:1476-2210(+)